MPPRSVVSYVLVGAAPGRLWTPRGWSAAVPLLDPLVRACRGPVGVRTTQGQAQARGKARAARDVRFGRLGWDEASHARWPTRRGDGRSFALAEVWAPHWKQACDDGPDLFLALEDPFLGGRARRGQWNQLLHLAVERSVHVRLKVALRGALEGLYTLLGGVAAFVRAAPWLDDGDCVQDALQNHFRYLGVHDARVPDAARLAEEGFVPYEPGTPLPRPDRLRRPAQEAHASEHAQEPGRGRAQEPGPCAGHDGGARRGGPVVYDKARYHHQGTYPDDLPIEQAFVHTGLYFGWLLENGLVDPVLAAGDARDVRARRRTGPQVFAAWDGCLVDEMLTPEGNAFTAEYFDFDGGRYLDDYAEVLGEGLPTLYHVPDTWESYDKLKVRLDERFAAWRAAATSRRPPARGARRSSSRTPRGRAGPRRPGGWPRAGAR